MSGQSSPPRLDGTQPAIRPRVLFVNRSYWPDVEATGQLLTELCEDLAADFEVHVLCGQPRAVAGDESFQRVGTQQRRGVTIHRVRHSQFDKASFWGRICNMASFQAAAAWRAFCVPRPAVAVVETDPPLLCLLGGMLRRLRGCNLVCYLQDIYPDVAVALGKLRDGIAVRMLRRLFFAMYRRSDAMVVLSQDMRRLLAENGVPGHKLHVVRNWVDSVDVHPVKHGNRFRHDYGLKGKFVVMYSGNMGLSQRLEQAIDAADALRRRDDVVFAMVGDGAERRNLERLVSERGLSNVQFFDYQPKSQLAESLSAADLHLVILRPEVTQLLMPSKLYGVLASGTPALVVADRDCELAQVVAKHDLGVLCPGQDGASLASAIVDAMSDVERLKRQGLNARRYAEASCDRRHSVDAFRDVLAHLVARPAPERQAPSSIAASAAACTAD